MAVPSSIKTINQKIRRLGRKYGTESLEYQKYLSDVDRNFKVHYTKDGIMQINQLKNISKYQSQIINKLQGRKGIRELEKASKERIYKERVEQAKARGITNPTAKDIGKISKAEIEKETRRFSERQKEIDDVLDVIYIEESAGSLPTDIADLYNKIHRHGKGAGSGLSNSDIDRLIEQVHEWQDVKEEIEQLSNELDSLGRSDEYLDSEIWESMSGRLTLEQCKDVLEKLREYRQNLDL